MWVLSAPVQKAEQLYTALGNRMSLCFSVMILRRIKSGVLFGCLDILRLQIGHCFKQGAVDFCDCFAVGRHSVAYPRLFSSKGEAELLRQQLIIQRCAAFRFGCASSFSHCAGFDKAQLFIDVLGALIFQHSI